MKKKALRKDFYIEIRRTFPRFLSIFLIVALGVAFFSGVRATEPDMRLSADAFYDASELMDIRVLGELGLTEEDVRAVEELEGVEAVMPGYSYDVLWQQETEGRAVKLLSLPDRMNRITVTEGRLPKESGECLMDDQMARDAGVKIGDTVRLSSGDDTALADIVERETYTVTGFGSTALYLSLERGTTGIGNGSLDGFLVLPAEDFVLEAYTEICLTVRGAAARTCYTEDYDDWVDTVEDRLEAIAPERCEIRYAEVTGEAAEQIAEGRADIEEAKRELADAGQELADGETELADAREELAGHERDLADARTEITDAERDIADGKVQLADGWEEYRDGVEQSVEGMDALKASEAQLAEAEEQVNEGYAQAEAGEARLAEGYAQIDGGIAQLEAGLLELASQEEALLAQGLPEEALAEALAQLAAAREELNGQLAALQEQRAGLDAQAGVLAASRAELDAASAYLEEKWKEWDAGYWEIRKGLDQLEEAERTLKEKEQELLDGEQQLKDARAELLDGEQKIADAKEELADGEAELLEGKREYEEKSADAAEEIADGEEKIRDAEEELADLEVPKWYVLDRNTIQTYVEYGQNADRIGAIGEVFPAIFFLVAALVSLTTMTRMVEEQRTQIGTLKALGYSRFDIAKKYVYYALLASVLGSVLGCVVGQKLLPYVIIQAYKIMYNNLPRVLNPMSLKYSLTASGIAVLCTVSAALISCWRELRSVPALLMRPETPKAGKRVALERLSFVWRRLNFTQKSTVRNLIRYKKRFFMTVFGIGGCMALLLVGYGVRDSLICIGDVEFGEIRTYSGTIVLEEDAEEADRKALLDALSEDERIEKWIWAEEKAMDAGSAQASSDKSVSLIVPQDAEALKDFIVLRERRGQKALTVPEDGVIITEKLAKLLSAEVGDAIYLKDGDADRKEVTVGGIAENYFMHYVYMGAGLYERLFGEAPEFGELFVQNASEEEAFEEALQADYMQKEAVASVSFLTGTSERVRDMLRSMDTLIYVLVISAGLLAFVVLYNLNNINITERRRELATLRVLGFYNKEVSRYVFRENVVLTFIGVLAGIVLGVVLHRFVVLTAEIDSMMFGRTISGWSYVYSTVLTFVFSGIVNGSMYFKVKKIDMVESLKSVE